ECAKHDRKRRQAPALSRRCRREAPRREYSAKDGQRNQTAKKRQVIPDREIMPQLVVGRQEKQENDYTLNRRRPERRARNQPVDESRGQRGDSAFAQPRKH